LEAVGAEPVIVIVRFGFVGQEVEFVTRVVQAIDEPARRSPCMCAPPDLHQAILHAHGHSLIENETFALPVFVSEFLLIGGDPAMKLKDVTKPLASQKR
jgi:hypothetical protein